MINRKCSIYRCALVIFVAIGAVFCCLPSGAYAGGVHLGFGVDVPLPGCAVAPPVEVYTPPVVVERTAPHRVVVEEVAPPERVVVERPPARVVVEQAPPRVVYEGPVVVEQRSTVTTYYPPAPRHHEYREESEREYHDYSSSSYHSSSYRADEIRF